MDRSPVVRDVLAWYASNARDLPWRRPEATPWQIMISEFMLQQTPVERVRGPWQTWVERWPTPTALAQAPSGEAVRAWGRLGYPRRALRLHQAAVAIRDRHDGRVPDRLEDLLALPGVGAYTAAAVASFAFGQRQLVLDTNVRRVITRIALGIAHPGPAPTVEERRVATEFLPRQPRRAARWAVASMELGALICTARTPRCEQCPVARACAWRSAGRPAPTASTQTSARIRRPSPGYAGTDRQCRGVLLAVLRADDEPVPAADLDRAWPDGEQRGRALASLVTDGLAVRVGDEHWSLPG